MHDKNIKWFKIADSKNEIHWQQNNLAIAEVAGKKITIAIKDEKMWACAYKCPHAGGILSNGFIDAAGNIVCPLHRYKFDLANGRNTSGEGYYLKVFTIELREAGIFIGFESNNWFNLFR